MPVTLWVLREKRHRMKGAPSEEQTDAAVRWEGGQPFSYFPFLLWFGALPCPFLGLKIKYWSKKKFLSSNGCSVHPIGQWEKIQFHLFNFCMLTETTSYWTFHFRVPLWSSSYFQPLKKPKDGWNTCQNTWLIHPYIKMKQQRKKKP